MAPDPTTDPLERPARSVIGDDSGGTLDLSYGNGFDAGPAHAIPEGTRTAQFNNSDYTLGNMAFVGWRGMAFQQSALDFSCFHRADLSSATLLFGCTAWGCDFSFAWLQDITLGNITATASDFTGVNMDGAICRTTLLPGFGGVYNNSFDYCDFSHAILTNCDFTGCDFTRSCFIGADLTGSTLDGTTLAHVTYDSTTIWPVGFNASLRITGPVSTYADYSGQTLTGVDFTGGISGEVAGVFLGHANFRGATLNNCLLSPCMEADFTDAQLMNGTVINSWYSPGYQFMQHAKLRGATIDLSSGDDTAFAGNLCFADLTEATLGFFAEDPPSTEIGWGLQNMNLSYAALKGLHRHGIQLIFNECNLSCADLSGASLSSVVPGIVEAGAGPYANYPWVQEASSNFSYAILDGVIGGWYSQCMIAHASFQGASLTNSSFQVASIAATDFTGAAATTSCFDGTRHPVPLMRGLPGDGLSPVTRPAWQSVRATNASIFPPGVDVTTMNALAEGPIERSSSLDLVWDTHSDFDSQKIQMTFFANNVNLTFSEAVNLTILGNEDPGPANDVTATSNVPGISWGGQTFDNFDANTSNFGLPIPAPIYGPLDVGTATTRSATRNRNRTVADARDTGTVMTF